MRTKISFHYFPRHKNNPTVHLITNKAERQKDITYYIKALQCAEVLSHVTETVEVAADAAEVTERGQQSVQPQTTAEVSVLHIRLTQFGVSFPVR